MKMKSLAFVGVMAVVALGFSAGVARAEEASSSVPVHVTMVASGVQLFDGDVHAVACDSDGAGTFIFTAYCAVSQAEASSSWSWWGSDAFLDSINGVTNDNTNGWYWGWFANLVYGETAMNKHLIVAGDRILVLLNTVPLRLSASALTPTVGDTVSFSVEEFGYDANWNPVWKPSAESHIVAGSMDIATDASGTQTLVITSTDPLTVFARKDGNFVQSPSLTIAPVAAPVASVEAPVSESGGGSNSHAQVIADVPVFDLVRAVDFLMSFQESNGSFGDQMYTDWATVALKAAAKAGSATAQIGLEKVRDYLVSKPLSSSVSLTDNERHALALMAAGVNPYTGTEVNYIQRIINEFDGEQFGDAALENDDIFALLILLKAGYKGDDEMVRESANFLVSRQKSSGAWIGVDVTAAAIQALRPLVALPGVTGAVTTAEDYLKGQQEADGGFGNVYSLSWALQALGGALPGADEALAEEQRADGGFREESAANDNRLWATAYAIPGALHRSWPSLMSSYKKVETVLEDEGRDEEKVVNKIAEPELVVDKNDVPSPEPVVLVPVQPVKPAEILPIINIESVNAPDTAQPVVEPAPFTASAIEVVGDGNASNQPILIGGFVLLGAVIGFFVLRAL